MNEGLTEQQINAAHQIADLENRRTALLRAANRSVWLLGGALDALHNERYEITNEYVERVLADLKDALQRQKGN